MLVPGNIYGPHDNFDLTNSHVIPALIRKFSEARRDGQREVVSWGTGRATRDFIYIQDACEAILLGAATYSGSDIINLSSGNATTIRDAGGNHCRPDRLPGRNRVGHEQARRPVGKGFRREQDARHFRLRVSHASARRPEAYHSIGTNVITRRRG